MSCCVTCRWVSCPSIRCSEHHSISPTADPHTPGTDIALGMCQVNENATSKYNSGFNVTAGTSSSNCICLRIEIASPKHRIITTCTTSGLHGNLSQLNSYESEQQSRKVLQGMNSDKRQRIARNLWLPKLQRWSINRQNLSSEKHGRNVVIQNNKVVPVLSSSSNKGRARRETHRLMKRLLEGFLDRFPPLAVACWQETCAFPRTLLNYSVPWLVQSRQ